MSSYRRRCYGLVYLHLSFAVNVVLMGGCEDADYHYGTNDYDFVSLRFK